MSHQENEDLTRRLNKLREETGYNIVQINGQRIFGGPPPGWTGQNGPVRGTEVYCYKLPRDCYEDELVPVFTRAGRIFEMRMMIDFSGANRGYCYVRYCKIEEAQKAIKTLNNFQIRPKRHLGVSRSVDNKRLCLRTVPFLPPTFTAEEVLQEVQRVLEGAITVSFLDKWWIMVEFSSHMNAAQARRKVVPGNVTIFRNLIKKVEWAVPDMEDYLQRNKTISVRNLPKNINQQRISRAFNFLCEGGKVEEVTIDPSTNSALVTFTSPRDAKSVVDRGSNVQLDGLKAQISWCGAQEKVENVQRKEKEREKEEPGASRPQQSGEDRSHSGQAVGGQKAGQGVEGPVETLLRFSLRHGWGVPQYTYQTALTPYNQLLYMSSVSFTALPGILVTGLPAIHPDLAAFNAAWTALEGISRSFFVPPTVQSNVQPSVAQAQCSQYYYYYYPVQAPEQTFTSVQGPQT